MADDQHEASQCERDSGRPHELPGGLFVLMERVARHQAFDAVLFRFARVHRHQA